MQALFFNQAMMNAAEAFGIDLVTEVDLDEKLGYAEYSHAVALGEAIVEYFKLGNYGIKSASDKNSEEPKDYDAMLLDAGIIDSKSGITAAVNVIATKTDRLVFCIGDCDQRSSINDRILNALGKTMGMSEVLRTSIWSHHCKTHS
ncbi:hypothetical protein [Vibrio phage vB_pir03]|nr:hypothetical protein [Vibrio phage vB_pir03]